MLDAMRACHNVPLLLLSVLALVQYGSATIYIDLL
jgi:hypothetical protein